MQARYFTRNSDADAVDGGHTVDDGTEPRDPDHVHEDEAGVFDGVMPETSEGHTLLCENLVKQFQIRYERNEVKWLKFPERATWLKCFPDKPYEPEL